MFQCFFSGELVTEQSFQITSNLLSFWGWSGHVLNLNMSFYYYRQRSGRYYFLRCVSFCPRVWGGGGVEACMCGTGWMCGGGMHAYILLLSSAYVVFLEGNCRVMKDNNHDGWYPDSNAFISVYPFGKGGPHVSTTHDTIDQSRTPSIFALHGNGQKSSFWDLTAPFYIANM